MVDITYKDLDKLKPIVSRCLQDAVAPLSSMLGKPMRVSEPELSAFDAADIPLVFGGSQKVVTGVYLGYHGENVPVGDTLSYDGHLLLTFKIDSAYEMVAILTEGLRVPLDELAGITDSIFSEIGNVFGASFISALSNTVGVRILVSVPKVINYRSNAILDFLYDKMKKKEGSVLLIKIMLSIEDHSVEGAFLLIPEDYRSLLVGLK